MHLKEKLMPNEFSHIVCLIYTIAMDFSCGNNMKPLIHVKHAKYDYFL